MRVGDFTAGTGQFADTPSRRLPTSELLNMRLQLASICFLKITKRLVTCIFSLWPPYVIGQAIIFLPRGFYLSFFYLFCSPNLSAVGDWMSTILPHMVWP